ncbi:unnamed protein product [Prunus armeniaca]
MPQEKSVYPIRPAHCTVPHFTRRIGTTQVLTHPGVRRQSHRTLKAHRSLSILLEQGCYFSWHGAKPMRTQDEGVLEQMKNVFIQILPRIWEKSATNLNLMLINPISGEISMRTRRGGALGTSIWRRHFFSLSLRIRRTRKIEGSKTRKTEGFGIKVEKELGFR